MFGYIVPDKPNMRIKDFTLYKAYYCGMCKSIKKRDGNFLRLGVNYDIALLSLVIHNILKEEPRLIDAKCFVNPLRKHKEVAPDKITERIADVNTLMAYYKCADDIADEGGLKARIGKAVYRASYKKARRALPGTDASLELNYEKLRALEKEKKEGIDPYADVFGAVMRDMGKELCGEKLTQDAAQFMYLIGRWIYLADAADDMARDEKKGCFNPILNRYKPEKAEEIYEKRGQELTELMEATENEIIRIYDNMEITVSEAPLSNVIYMGLAARRVQVLNNKGEKCQKIRL